MDEQDRELRQYFEDLYITFLGSAMKNGHALNPDAILKDTETHYIALVAKLKTIRTRDVQL
jgi:hypothetical protein